MNVSRRLRWQYPVIAVVAAGAATLGLLQSDTTAGTAASAKKDKPGATDRIKQHPPPTLFAGKGVAALARQETRLNHTADRLFANWQAEHGATRDDSAFSTWVALSMPAPPRKRARTAELHTIQKLAKSRTAAGKKAATWLEVNGKKDIWKLYLHDQRELIPQDQGAVEKKQLKTALKLSKKITEQLAAHYRQSAPYVLDPSLRPEKHIARGQKGHYSYPSRHGAKSAAAVTLLSAWAPHRAEDYRAMAAQVTFSRLYMAGHVRSDILTGILLGDLVGDYVLTTNGHALPGAKAPAGSAGAM